MQINVTEKLKWFWIYAPKGESNAAALCVSVATQLHSTAEQLIGVCTYQGEWLNAHKADFGQEKHIKIHKK